MSTIIEATAYPVAVLLIPNPHDAAASYAMGVFTGITDNIHVNPPPAELAALEADAEAYAKANIAARDGGKTAIAARKAARAKVVKDLKQLQGRVQAAGEMQPSPTDAAALIVSVGMSVKKVVKRNKPAVRASHGATSGTVVLDALRVAAVAMYLWQFSLDQQHWSSVPQGMKSKVVVTGLTPGQVYYFRFQAHTRKGLGDFSQVVSLMVL